MRELIVMQPAPLTGTATMLCNDVFAQPYKGCSPHPSRGRQLQISIVELLHFFQDAARTPHGDGNWD